MSEQDTCPKCGANLVTSDTAERGDFDLFACGSESYDNDKIPFYATKVCQGRQQARAEIAERLRGISGNFYTDYEETYEAINSLIAELEGEK